VGLTRFWNIDELAEYLGVAKTWIYDRTRDQGPERIPHVKLGKYVRFNPESVEFQGWVSNHVVGAETQQDFQTIETKSSK